MSPYRMLSDRELRNFARFIRPNPQGASDSARPGSSKPAHIARLKKGVPLSAFGPGGAYDAAPEDDLPATDRAVLVALARDLSDVEWLALKRTLCGEGAEAEDNDLPDEKRQAPAMDAFMLASRIQPDRYPRDNRPARPASAEGAASFFALYPDAAPVRRI